MTDHTLSALGWSDHFARQRGLDDPLFPARLSAVHRDRLDALSPQGPLSLQPSEIAGAYAVGDWVLTDGTVAHRRLDPLTDLARRAAGKPAASQRIAANIDTVGIVTSCNADFNPARLERYLALVSASGALPLVILTKADLCPDPAPYRREVERLSALVSVLTLDATDLEDAARLAPWCRDGRTLALVGSSGTGKTTLRNALTGGEAAATQAIRANDARGRHTTTARNLVPTRFGGWLVDTPGMRELQLAEADEGIATVFDDIEALAQDCRFADCRHATEPGCAVRAALAAGRLDPDRLARWEKLRNEDRHNSETVAEARARAKGFAKRVKGATQAARRKRDPEV